MSGKPQDLPLQGTTGNRPKGHQTELQLLARCSNDQVVLYSAELLRPQVQDMELRLKGLESRAKDAIERADKVKHIMGQPQRMCRTKYVSWHIALSKLRFEHLSSLDT